MTAPTGRRREIPWQTISYLTAIASLVATLLFSSFQVASSARQSEETRQAVELQLFTQLNQLVLESQRRIELDDPSEEDEAALRQALGGFDYVAWLFNNRFLTLDEARVYWEQPMACAMEVAAGVVPDARRQYADLARHVQRGPRCQG